jgi:hypothetical protein
MSSTLQENAKYRLNQLYNDILHEFKNNNTDSAYIINNINNYENAIENYYLDYMEDKQILKTHKKQLKECQIELEFKINSNRNELLKDHKIDIKHDLNTADGLVQYGKEIITDSNSSLVRTIQNIEESKKIGSITLTKINQQNEQINKISQDTVEIDSTLSRTNKIIKRIARKIYGDKCICTSIMFIIIFIIIICVLKYANYY